MPKRWAALPRGIRWLAGIAVVVLALAIVWALFVPVADWLAHHDVGSVKGSLHETAVDNARGRLLTLGAGLFAAAALVFTARNFTLSRRTFELTEQGQVTDRYTKAIEQLGSDKLDVRIGGIYALERVARDSARDHPTVMEVLTAFIREHSRGAWPEPDPGGQEQERSIRSDVQAAVTVVGRRDAKRDIRPIDLTGAHLARADLRDADLARVDLRDADLARVNLRDADLAGADFTRADLQDADLTGAILGGADLTGANLRRASLFGADLAAACLIGTHLIEASLIEASLIGADLRSAHLTRAILPGADLTRANLIEADLTRADLRGADLTGAILRDTGAILRDADLTGADLIRARWSGDVPAPEGWERDASSGRLKRAGTDSKPAGAD